MDAKHVVFDVMGHAVIINKKKYIDFLQKRIAGSQMIT